MSAGQDRSGTGVGSCGEDRAPAASHGRQRGGAVDARRVGDRSYGAAPDCAVRPRLSPAARDANRRVAPLASDAECVRGATRVGDLACGEGRTVAGQLGSYGRRNARPDFAQPLLDVARRSTAGDLPVRGRRGRAGRDCLASAEQFGSPGGRIVGVGGGLIGPMRQRMERLLTTAERETTRARDSVTAYQAGRQDAMSNQPVRERTDQDM